MADAARSGQPAQQADHVVAGRPDRLVEVNDPEHRRGRARARTRRARWLVASASGASTVQPAARAWPPPPKAEVMATASARAEVRTLTRTCVGVASLKRTVMSAAFVDASRSMNPSLATGSVPVSASIARVMVAYTIRPSRSCAGAGQDAAPQREGAERLVGVDRAMDGRQRRAGLDEVGRDAQRARRGVRVREGVRVLHDPGGQDGRDVGVDLDAQVGDAAAPPSRTSPPRRRRPRPPRPRSPSFETWWSMFTIRARASHRPQSRDDRAGARERAVDDDREVGLEPGRASAPRPRTAGARSDGGTGSAATTSACLPSRSAAMRSASAEPSVSASGFSWQMAVMRVGAADRLDDRLAAHESRPSSSSRRRRSTRSPASIESSWRMTSCGM